MKRLIPILSLISLAGVALASDAAPFKKAKEIPLPGKGGFEYCIVEPVTRRLLVAHASKIDVIDLDREKVIGEVSGVDGAHGAVIVPELKRGFATAGKKKKVIVFDTETLKTVKEVETGEGPDAILHVAAAKEVWSMNHRAGTITCIDASSLEVKATIDVGGALEFAVAYSTEKADQVFVNVENRDLVAAIDVKTHAVTARYPLAPAKEPAGLAIDAKAGVLFAGCGSGDMAVLDASSGKVLSTIRIGQGCDAAAFDPGTGFAFASCRDGTTTVVRGSPDRTFAAAGTIETAKGGRTCAVDPKTHKLWVAAGTRGKDDVRLLVFAPEATDVH